MHGDLCKHLGKDSSTDPEGMSVLLIFCKLQTFKCLNFYRGYISFTLSVHESSSGLIASEICNSLKV